MGEAILIQRGSSSGEVISEEVIVEFDNFMPSNIDSLDEELIHSIPTALSVARGGMAGASVGNYALFAGGISDPSSYLFDDTVDAYDTSLTRSTPTTLSIARGDIAGASVGNYTLFAGGFTLNGMISSGSDVVDAYDTSLTRSTPTVLSVERESPAGASVGNYALFAGGFTYPYEDYIDAYDTSLTRSTSTALSVAREYLAGASVGDYALFAGGSVYVSGTYTTDTVDTVEAYDTSLTRSTPTTLSVAREGLVGASVGNYALFAGGISDPSSFLLEDTVDAYDTSLTRSTPTALSVVRDYLAGASVGNYALFAGGISNDASTCHTVDAYSPVPVVRLYMPIGTKYKFGESEETATTNEITVPVPVTGYIKFKNGVISNEV